MKGPSGICLLNLTASGVHIMDFHILLIRTWARYCPRFFDQVGHQTTYAFIGNKHFSLNHVIVIPTKIINRADKN